MNKEEPGSIEITLDHLLELGLLAEATQSIPLKPLVTIFEGPTGVGKTARVKAWAEEKGITLISEDAFSYPALEEYLRKGLPQEALYQDYYARLSAKPRTVLFLDDYQNRTPSLYAFFRPILERLSIPFSGKEKRIPGLLFVVGAKTLGVAPTPEDYNLLSEKEDGTKGYREKDFHTFTPEEWFKGQVHFEAEHPERCGWEYAEGDLALLGEITPALIRLLHQCGRAKIETRHSWVSFRYLKRKEKTFQIMTLSVPLSSKESMAILQIRIEEDMTTGEIIYSAYEPLYDERSWKVLSFMPWIVVSSEKEFLAYMVKPFTREEQERSRRLGIA